MTSKSNLTLWIRGRSDEVLAFVVRANYKADGVEFLTPDDYGQQIGYMTRPTGETIQPHVHEQITRTLIGTQEVLVIRSGKLRLDLFEHDQSYVGSTFLGAGDVVLLNKGGHSLYVIEEAEIIEIKQGPYAEGRDKTRFEMNPLETITEIK
jgi:hypothetical protein